jgi:hypothetical protein
MGYSSRGYENVCLKSKKKFEILMQSIVWWSIPDTVTTHNNFTHYPFFFIPLIFIYSYLIKLSRSGFSKLIEKIIYNKIIIVHVYFIVQAYNHISALHKNIYRQNDVMRSRVPTLHCYRDMNIYFVVINMCSSRFMMNFYLYKDLISITRSRGMFLHL